MKVYELLSDESKWTVRAYARDETGAPVDVNNEKAICWCARGAIAKCYLSYSDHFEVVEELEKKIKTSVISWNDSVTYEEVIKVFKEINR